jgi:hypothetical protein
LTIKLKRPRASRVLWEHETRRVSIDLAAQLNIYKVLDPDYSGDERSSRSI